MARKHYRLDMREFEQLGGHFPVYAESEWQMLPDKSGLVCGVDCFVMAREDKYDDFCIMRDVAKMLVERQIDRDNRANHRLPEICRSGDYELSAMKHWKIYRKYQGSDYAIFVNIGCPDEKEYQAAIAEARKEIAHRKKDEDIGILAELFSWDNRCTPCGEPQEPDKTDDLIAAITFGLEHHSS